MQQTGAQRPAFPIPTVTVQSLLIGMLATNVLNGVVVLLLLSVIPFLFLLIASYQHPSVMKLRIISRNG